MISEAEVRRIAGGLGVEPTVVDHDYALGCFLHFLGLQPHVQESWVFKGGTSLCKCYFPEYRFSEDLDFTATKAVSESVLHHIVREAKNAMQESIGIRTDARDVLIDKIEDDYGKEYYEARVSYEGPWEYGGSPRSIRVHVNRDEKIVFPVLNSSIIHPFSDPNDLPKSSVSVYSLEELFVEKLRAFSGQRKRDIARDVYDLHYLSRGAIDINKAIEAFPQKWTAKGISLVAIDISRVAGRKEGYAANWRNNLEYLIPAALKMPFEEAWDTSIRLLRRVLDE
ncbi:MAG: nucleotidyl transferase AbiEii/AbiGii toxin family protein [Bacteroidota bacterium]